MYLNSISMLDSESRLCWNYFIQSNRDQCRDDQISPMDMDWIHRTYWNASNGRYPCTAHCQQLTESHGVRALLRRDCNFTSGGLNTWYIDHWAPPGVMEVPHWWQGMLLQRKWGVKTLFWSEGTVNIHLNLARLTKKPLVLYSLYTLQWSPCVCLMG